MEFKPRKMPGGDRFYLKDQLASYLKSQRKGRILLPILYPLFTSCSRQVNPMFTFSLPIGYPFVTFCLPRRYLLGKEKVMPEPFDAGTRVMLCASCLPAGAQISGLKFLKFHFLAQLYL